MWNGEHEVDRIIYELSETTCHPSRQKVFLEIGGGHPITLSNSYAFREKGWLVICVEPNPELVSEFEKLGLQVLKYAAANRDIGEVDFYVSDQTMGMAYSSMGIRYGGSPKTKTIKAQALSMETILQRHFPNLDQIDVVSVDCEGWEIEALAGLDMNRRRPSIVVVENFAHLHEYADFMLRRKYSLAKIVGGYNYIFVPNAPS